VPKAFPPASAKPSNAPAQEQPSHAESSPQVKQALSAPEVNLFRKLFGTKPLQPGAPPATASSASSTEVHQQPSAGAQLNTKDYQYVGGMQARERALALEDQPVVDASALGAQARQLYSAKKYTDALPIAKRACGLNNATGCLITAQMYQYGEGEMPPSINDAIPFYRQACDENSADGCFRLAVVFAAQGFHSQADALWQRACDLHDPEGCQRVGVHYLREKDYDKALVFLGRACDANLPYSCGDLGSIYEHSPALPDNKKQALQFYTKACTLGDAEACKRRRHLKL
jgi:TPR repeat protein